MSLSIFLKASPEALGGVLNSFTRPRKLWICILHSAMDALPWFCWLAMIVYAYSNVTMELYQTLKELTAMRKKSQDLNYVWPPIHPGRADACASAGARVDVYVCTTVRQLLINLPIVKREIIKVFMEIFIESKKIKLCSRWDRMSSQIVYVTQSAPKAEVASVNIPDSTLSFKEFLK
uniref:Uncharacterized protein n=1 Tax=Glossina pallidipes TaxID=7398 RepID=A0A1B0A678_GLOPL